MSVGQGIAQLASTQLGTQGGWRYTNGRSEAWCADFVTWVLAHFGLADDLGSPSVGTVEQKAQARGWWRSRGSPYVPKPGDLVTFNYRGGADHIGIVRSVNSDGTFTTVEGNTNGGGETAGSGSVGSHTYSIRDDNIRGFVSINGKGGGNFDPQLALAGLNTGGPVGGGDAMPPALAGLLQRELRAENRFQNALMDALAGKRDLMQVVFSPMGGPSMQEVLRVVNSLPADGGNLAALLGSSGVGASGVGSPGFDPGPPVNLSDKQDIIQMAVQVAHKYGIPPNIFLAIINKESGFNPRAVGDGGASFGLGQVYTTVHHDFNVQRALHGAGGNPDVRYQLEYSAQFLKRLHDQYGSWSLAVEHYNGSGPAAEAYMNSVLASASGTFGRFGGNNQTALA